MGQTHTKIVEACEGQVHVYNKKTYF